ncbi:MAG: hypothetical protein JWN69_2520 [Alphaproteobacteria bacterium]|nr:hypothetical protein [Alphaproteobacteria bacterium]
MDEIETTNPVDGEALPETEVDTGGSAAEPMLDDDGNPIDALEGDEEGPDADEMEAEQLEIERDGKIAKIPAWLKPELMMQADYTRKTQELADARRALEAERTTVQHASEAEISAQANLSLIDGQIARYAKVDWNAWHDGDPFEAQKAFAQFQLLKDARQQTAHHLGHVRQERAFKEQQESAKRLETGAAELARDLKDWSPQTAAKLLDFGQRHYGFSQDDLDGIDDPRLVKVLHAAFQWEEHQKKQRQAQKHAAAQAVRPAAKVGGASPKPGLDDRLSADEWLRRRNEQLRKRG